MADDTDRIEILLRAQHRDFRRAIDRSNKLLAKFEKDADRHMSRSQKAIDSRLAAMGGSIKTFAAGAVGGLLAGALAMVTSEAAQTVRGVAAIGDEARRSGLGVQQFQELSFVAQQSRIPIDSLIDGMKELNLRADEFVTTGQGPAAEAFARLGLGAKDLKEGLKDPSELLLDVIDRMEDLDRAAQIRVADEIFGGTGGERFVELMARGDDGIRQLMTRAHELGVVMDAETIEKAAELDRKFGEIQTRVSTLAKIAVVELGAAIQDAFTIDADELDRSLSRIEDAARVLGDIEYSPDSAALGGQAQDIEDLAVAHQALAAQARDMARALEDAAFSLNDQGYSRAAIDLFNLAEGAEGVARAFEDGRTDGAAFRDELMRVATEADTVTGALDNINTVEFTTVVSRIGAIIGALQAAINKAVELQQVGDAPAPQAPGMTPRPYGPIDYRLPQRTFAPTESVRPQLPSVDASFGTGGGGGGGGRSRGGGGRGGSGSVSEYRREVEATKEAIIELQVEAEALAAVADSGLELGDAMEYARKRAELLVAAQKDGRAITPELTAEIDKLAMSHMEAALAAEEHADRLEKVRDDAKKGMDALDDMFLSIVDGSKSAVDVLRDLVLQIAKVQISNGLQGLAEGSPLVGFLGSLLTPRATGGPMRKGNAYRINEHTPREEVFVPGANGAMLNVPQAQAALARRDGASRGGTSVAISMPIDARGAQEGVAEQIERALVRHMPEIEKRTVAAAYKANSEVPFR